MAGRTRQAPPEDILEALPRLRDLCASLPDCEEALSYGNPAFKHGRKPFAILDRYKGQSCLWILFDPVLRDDQLAVPGWFASPYDPRVEALCCSLDKLDWAELRPLIEASHRLAKPAP